MAAIAVAVPVAGTTPLYPDATLPSSGIPIAQGVLMGEAAAAIDAVPLIDAATAQVLGQVDSFTIVQRPSLTEALCAACERSNIYDIYDGATGQHIFYAKERSECLWRLCCAPRHSLFVEFKLSVRVPPQLIFATDVDAMPISMTMEREGMPSKPCLGCCVCAPGCKDGMYLHAGPVGEAAGPGSRNCVGFATQPSWGGGFVPTLNVMERANGGANAANVWNALAKVEGPTCFGGCSELCFSSKFGVSKFSAGQVDAAVKSADLATIVKRKPHDLAGAMREAATDADLYTLQLNPAANLAPQQKAILLASLVLSDYMFFERDGPACNGNGCTLCNIYCCGCLCPCAINCPSHNSGPQRGGGGFNADQ